MGCAPAAGRRLACFVRAQVTQRARTVVEGTRFLHRELWRVVTRQIDHRNANPVGAFYDDLVAMVFAFHTFEAYLNYAGELLAPETWANERNFFSKQPYRGFDGKVRKILELADLPEPSRAIRPYSTIWMLKAFRDTIAHARPERFGSAVEHSTEDEPSLHATPMDATVTRDNADRAKVDVETFIEQIHVAAKPKISDIWFGPSALSGPLQFSSGSTTLAP